MTQIDSSMHNQMLRSPVQDATNYMMQSQHMPQSTGAQHIKFLAQPQGPQFLLQGLYPQHQLHHHVSHPMPLDESHNQQQMLPFMPSPVMHFGPSDALPHREFNMSRTAPLNSYPNGGVNTLKRSVSSGASPWSLTTPLTPATNFGMMQGAPSTTFSMAPPQGARASSFGSTIPGDLMFVGFLADEAPYNSIRIWKNSRDITLYDCVCGSRKPNQGLKKMKLHAERHLIERHICEDCDKEFSHHWALNAHRRIHKKLSNQSSGTKTLSPSSHASDGKVETPISSEHVDASQKRDLFQPDPISEANALVAL